MLALVGCWVYFWLAVGFAGLLLILLLDVGLYWYGVAWLASGWVVGVCVSGCFVLVLFGVIACRCVEFGWMMFGMCFGLLVIVSWGCLDGLDFVWLLV